MKLRENLELTHDEYLNELNLGFITNTFKALKDKSTEYIRNKVTSGWQNIKAVLETSKEIEEAFLGYLSYIFDREFNSVSDVDSILLQANEAVTWKGIKDYIKENYLVILGIIAIVAEVSLNILKTANLGLSVLYLLVSVAMLMSNENEVSVIKDLKKKTEKYQATVNKVLKATKKVDTARKALKK